MGNAPTKHQAKKSVRWNNAGPPSPPGRPFLDTSSSRSEPDVVVLRWEPPQDDGGAPVTGYLVEHRRTGSPHWVRSWPELAPRPHLALSGLEPGWRYQFRVTAVGPGGSSAPGELSQPLTVTLQRAAASGPLFTTGLEDVTALENEKAELNVQFTGTPTPNIAWFKDGFEIFSSRRMRVTTDGNQSTLIIYQTAFTDEGEIKCTATNRVGHVMTKARLRLEAPPSIRLPRQYEEGLLFEREEPLRLKVSVSGRPLPRVTWRHNGEQLVFGGRYEVSNTDRSSSLRVAEARREDRGEYQVRATSRLGEDVASVLVTVTDRPQPPGKARVVSTLGRSVTLSWSEPDDDGGCKIGNYIVEYYRIGWNVWLKAATCRQLTTTLGELIEGSEYKFRVKAENPYGVSDASEESDVLFIPDAKRGLLEPPARRPVPPVKEKEVTSPSDTNKAKMNPTNNLTTQQKTLKAEKPKVAASQLQAKNKANTDKVISSDIPLTVLEIETGRPEIIKRKHRQNVEKEMFTAKVPTSEKAATDKKASLKIQKESTGTMTTEPLSALTKPPQMPKVITVAAHLAEEDEKPLASQKVVGKGDESDRHHLILPLQPREDDDSLLHGSSELMLVLLPEQEEAQGNGEVDHESAYNLDDETPVAPPMSLSAPELGSAEPEVTSPIRNAVSSTELLHERAMARLYQAAAAEEQQKTRLRRASLEVTEMCPRPRGTSLEGDNSDVKEFLGRQLHPKHDLWDPVVRSAEDKNKLDGIKPKKNKIPAKSINVKSLLNRTEPVKLVSQEEEAADFARLREKLAATEAKRRSQRRIRDEELEEEELEDEEEEEEEEEEVEEEELLEESAGEEGLDDDDLEEEESPRLGLYPRSGLGSSSPVFNKNRRYDRYLDDDEEDTYHPRSMTLATKQPQPLVIPTVIKPRSVDNKSIDVKPKPILKLKSKFEEDIPQQIPEAKTLPEKPVRKFPPEQPPKSPSPEDAVVRRRRREEPPTLGGTEAERRDSDVGLTAAEVARDRRLRARQASIEDEAAAREVVVNHYGEIIREYGNVRRAPVVLYLDTEELKAAAQRSDEQLTSLRPTVVTPPAEAEVSKAPDTYFYRGGRVIQPQKKHHPTPVEEPEVIAYEEPQQTPEEDHDNTQVEHRPLSPEQILAERKVRSFFSYLTDLALFFLACWLYIFSDELFAIPILALMVYRQMQEGVRKRLPARWRRAE